jgi:dienelactone hydrolase
MDRWFARGASVMALLFFMVATQHATAQEEISPPSGKDLLVVVLSGATGSGNYRLISKRIAALGYNVVLFDSNAIISAKKGGPWAEPMRAAIARARQMPNALPGKIAVVGFSLGGGLALNYASQWNDDVAVVAAWYPSTSSSALRDSKAFVARIKVPVVMFAGTADEYQFCCMIDKAKELASAAKAVNAPLELTTYAGVGHGFSIPGTSYDQGSTDDALARTAAALKLYLGQ